ncbi:bifunctional non-homologous end joining protein LigD [Kitasatospora sp. MAP12-15]|uniref:non-homologous end-joining DNA ligase n=1 Tax=unclassified Kitasatospora TaxID=2633591 RepID=UPI002473F68C|nr:non-homologous end-joining DNA ligase [Kitasatospora sp. MAP12-44]MDH6108918.1 bifunctional non-homologous end joining protein LigD [Kitasatospora sp. MAP12-44]
MPDPNATVTEVEGRRLRLTHLDRVLYPRSGFTKAAVLHYYAQVGPVMVAHLRGRAASFLRLPEGVEGERFWAKRVPPGAPDWVASLDVVHRDETLRQVVVADLPTLLWAANLGCLEIHVPQWRGTPQTHDRLIVDLDPGPGTTVVECCAVALAARELLAGDGLRVWPKTTGSKGLHLTVPLVETPADQVGDYARELARRLRLARPELVVDKMAKQLRPGRVFVDWSQNNSAKTTAAAYSLRAGAEPGVSTPLTWAEVGSCEHPEQLAYTPAQVAARVAADGDLQAQLTDPAAAGELPG